MRRKSAQTLMPGANSYGPDASRSPLIDKEQRKFGVTLKNNNQRSVASSSSTESICAKCPLGNLSNLSGIYFDQSSTTISADNFKKIKLIKVI